MTLELRAYFSTARMKAQVAFLNEVEKIVVLTAIFLRDLDD